MSRMWSNLRRILAEAEAERATPIGLRSQPGFDVRLHRNGCLVGFISTEEKMKVMPGNQALVVRPRRDGEALAEEDRVDDGGELIRLVRPIAIVHSRPAILVRNATEFVGVPNYHHDP